MKYFRTNPTLRNTLDTSVGLLLGLLGLIMLASNSPNRFIGGALLITGVARYLMDRRIVSGPDWIEVSEDRILSTSDGKSLNLVNASIMFLGQFRTETEYRNRLSYAILENSEARIEFPHGLYPGLIEDIRRDIPIEGCPDS